MAVTFETDMNLLAEIGQALAHFKRLYWLIGGAATGKTTLSKSLAAEFDIPRYDIDEHSFGDFVTQYTSERHPATYAWYNAENPFGWILSLEWNEFSGLYRANNVETLDLLAADLSANFDPSAPLIVDGGITHPSVLGRVVAPERIVCLSVPPGESARQWETNPDRRRMLDMTLALADPDAARQRFLDYDRKLHDLCVRECREVGIRAFERTAETTKEEISGEIAKHWGFPATP